MAVIAQFGCCFGSTKTSPLASLQAHIPALLRLV